MHTWFLEERMKNAGDMGTRREGKLFLLLGRHVQPMEVLGLGVESELHLLAYTTATTDPSPICDLRGTLRQLQSLNPLSEARDRTCVLTDTMSGLNRLSHNGNSSIRILKQRWSIVAFLVESLSNWKLRSFTKWIGCLFISRKPGKLHHRNYLVFKISESSNYEGFGRTDLTLEHLSSRWNLHTTVPRSL